MIFPSRPGFIFHDTRGFESGRTDELDIVREFITRRAGEGSIKKQLHVIWYISALFEAAIHLNVCVSRYCLPTDHEARLLSAAEVNFFEECDTGHGEV